jgi:hypothetical protein
MPAGANLRVNKPFSIAEKRTAIELWKAGIPLKRIREQLNISESSLRRILKFAKENPLDPIAATKPEVNDLQSFHLPSGGT